MSRRMIDTMLQRAAPVAGLVIGMTVYTASAQTVGPTFSDCVATATTGFQDRTRKGDYERAEFKPERFRMRLWGGSILLDYDDEDVDLECRIELLSTDRRICNDPRGASLTMDVSTGRFVLSRGYGYALSNVDSVSISIGICSRARSSP